MKIRKGFVANSSSSSFIVNNALTTAQVATIMLYGVKEDWLRSDGKVHQSIQDAIDWLQTRQDFDEPIVFPWTCNYETFIWREDDGKIRVNTCNNQQEYWGMIGDIQTRYDDSFDEGSALFHDLESHENYTHSQYMHYREEKWRKYYEERKVTQ